ncbi:MAG: GNAT family N-acetyltransferase [Deltaproteobacteria bacterium]|nr:GNAT family N-acetyltransferase [Deltaproteobacteria bacterium]
MATKTHWADQYVEKKKDAFEAVRLIKGGQRVFIGSSCGEPQHLVKALAGTGNCFSDIEIVRLMAIEKSPLSLIADKTMCRAMDIRSFYLGSAKTKSIRQEMRFLTPINLSEIPRLFKTRQLPIHVALVQVSPPDDFGWMSLGVSVDITQAAALNANMVIAQVNSRMPRVLGQSFIHVDDVDVIVEHDEELLTISKMPETETANAIGQFAARLIDDGSTLQIGPGVSSQATLLALSNKKDLGVHSQYITDDIMHLVARGVITNRKKGFNDGKLVASSAVGSQLLYEYIHDNPSIDFHPSDYVNDPGIIARNNKMVCINVGMAMDLTGQMAADALSQNYYSAVTGIMDFMRGASRSPGGKSIILMTSTFAKGKRSRIVPILENTAVVVPRGDVHYVVTEYGVVNLFGKSFQERAMAMISIAHPDFREELFHKAKEMGLLGPERTLKESIHGVYPFRLEETREIDGETVVFRPAKPVDERRIQEHFYSLDKDDVVARFFHEKHSFFKDDLAGILQIDYVNDMTILAVVGEVGFGKVVGLGEYLLVPSTNKAEVAFSVSREYQGKKIGKILLLKLAQAALENGISGLFAVTSPSNLGMIHLFKTLPYKVKSVFEDDMVVLSCRFDEPS